MEEVVGAPAQLVIAMKGHPGTGKSTLARAIAKSLKCPLIDKDDVRDSTQHLQQSLLPASADAAKLLNDLSYEIIWRIAETQLHLGFSVVIDSPLSRRAHLDRILEFAASAAGGRVVIIECKPQDEDAWHRRLEERGLTDDASWHKPSTWKDLQKLLESYGGCCDYDASDVPKLVVDTTAPVKVGELVSAVVRFITHSLRQ